MHSLLTISVVVPVWNGAEYLSKCLEALSQSDTPVLERIVVDDGSTDNSILIAEASGAQVFRTRGKRGPAVARNLGVMHASGDIVIFVDSDVCVAPATLRLMRERFENQPDLDAVVGSYDDEPAAPGIASQYKNLLHHYVHQHGKAEAATFWSGCGAIRREAFEAVGGFDESYARPCIEDIDLGYRLREANRRILLDPAIQAKHLKQFHLLRLFRTDIFDRALPWTRLILQSNRLPNDLNVSVPQRVSAALMLAAAGLLLLSPFFALALVPALLALAGVVALNWDFYRFLASKRGWAFAIAAIPLHQAYYLYSPICFAVGVLLHYSVWRFQPAVRRRRVFGPVSAPARLSPAETEPETLNSFTD
ncbi:MAG: glycosyltransferase [Bryobacteraceae bacterium]